MLASTTTAARAATPLPDGRAYELVTTTPTDYGFGVSTGFGGVISAGLGQSSQSGDAIAFTTGSPPPDSVSGALTQWSIARRTATGWVDTSLNPPQDPEYNDLLFGVYPAFSPDLSTAIVTQLNPPLVPQAVANDAYLYQENTADNAFSPVSATPLGPPPASPAQPLDFIGASSDLNTVAYETYDNTADTPDTPPGASQEVYESVDGNVQLVGILPDGSPASDGAEARTGIPSTVSADGSHVFFSANPTPSSAYPNIYARIDGASTVDVSPSQRQPADPNGMQSRTFLGASSDGSEALFTSSEELTNDANTGSSGGTPDDQGEDLYQYDLTTGVLHDLSVDDDPADAASGADVLGVVGFSPDQSEVYFVATGDLAPGAVDGSPNLYLARDGTDTFIATLSAADSKDWGAQANGYSTGQVAPDSGDLLFASVSPLTGYDNTDASTGQADEELFRYDPTSQQLICVSCNPTGAAPLGPSALAGQAEIAQDRMAIQGRNMDALGTEVFFQSDDALVPADTNGTADVYEWEQDGTGTCTSASDAGGCISLLTPGDDDADAHFIDSSPDGANVFISSLQQLVPQDTGTVNNLYDVRTGGGFPDSSSSSTPPCTDTTSCQGNPPASTPPPTVATVTFFGPGNPSRSGHGARAKVLSHHVDGSRFSMRINAPRAGQVTISGASITSGRRRFAKAGTATMRLALDPAARRALARRRRLDGVKVHVRFSPTTGRGASQTIKLSFRETGR